MIGIGWRGKEGPANCKAVMSTSWKVKNKEERVGKNKRGECSLKFIITKWNKINDRMNEIK